MKRCLIIGYGSIGKRHREVLLSLGCDVKIVSKHLEPASGLFVYRDVEEAFSRERFDYVVIASATGEHAETLRHVLPFLSEKTICLVEKPLFSSVKEFVFWGNAKIRVGYVLRAHPLLRKVRQILNGRKLYSCRASCGQYLPSWRPGTDYRKCYSAQKRLGGGVLRDLSHELDYMQMLCGCWEKATALGGKFSDLEITSDDQYGILFSTKKCPLCMCHLDYLSQDTHRMLFVEYDGGSLKLDFVEGVLLHNGEREKVVLKRDDLFRTMHRELMEDNLTCFTDGGEALAILKLIEAAEKAAGRDIWIRNL